MRLLGIEIPDDKHIVVALTHIFGIGRSVSEKVLEKANIEPDRHTKDLKDEEINRIKNIIDEEHVIEGDLRRQRQQAVRHLKDIGSWRGERHKKGLPVRGQTTRVNSRTMRGNVRSTAGSGKTAPAPHK